MVNYKGDLSVTFAALSDPTRRAILARLARGEAAAGELAKCFDVSWPAVSRHLRVLKGAGLVVQRREGRVRRCRLEARPLRAAGEWIGRYRRFWTGQLDALAEFLESQGAAASAPLGRRKKEDTG